MGRSALAYGGYVGIGGTTLKMASYTKLESLQRGWLPPTDLSQTFPMGWLLGSHQLKADWQWLLLLQQLLSV